MMKAAVLHSFGPALRTAEVAVPETTPNQVLVKMPPASATRICMPSRATGLSGRSLPFIPGHEGVGYVAAVSAGVKGIKEGDRVGVPWLHTACGHREHCMTGWETLCDEQQMTGYTVNGAYAEYVLADPGYVGHLPANVTSGGSRPGSVPASLRTRL